MKGFKINIFRNGINDDDGEEGEICHVLTKFEYASLIDSGVRGISPVLSHICIKLVMFSSGCGQTILGSVFS